MNTKSLFGRMTSLTTRPADRPQYFRPRHEPLEQRQMLSADPVYINEIYWDPPGGLDNNSEYIELRGTPNQSLDNYYLIFLENEHSVTANAGVVERIFGFQGDSLGSNGFLTLPQKDSPYPVNPASTNLMNQDHDDVTVDPGWGAPVSSVQYQAEDNKLVIENSGFTAMLIHNVSGSAPIINTDLDVGDDGLDNPTGQTGWEIVDSIGIHAESNESVSGRLYAKINFGFGPSTAVEPGTTYVDILANYPWPVTEPEAEYLGRWGNSTGQTAADWHISNLTDAGDSGYLGDSNFRQSSDPHGAGNPVESTQGVPFGTGITNTLGSPNIPTSVAGTHLFYKGSSRFDVTNNNLPGFSDDNAIAPDKTAYRPGTGTSTFSAVSSYTRGINGVMVDLIGPHGTITANDFTFKVGNNNSPSAWAAATAPTAVTIRSGAGVGGSDRVELLWANNAIQKQWLEVIVKGNDTLGGSNTNSGLQSSYVFYFGNALGDSGSGDASTFVVTSADEQSARNDPHSVVLNPATITNVNDYNRDGAVNTTDQQTSRNNPTIVVTTALKFLNVGAGGPFAPAADTGAASAAASGDAGIASSLAAAAKVEAPAPTDARERVEQFVHRLNAHFTRLAERGTSHDIAVLQAADQFAHDHNFDREAQFLDDLLAGIE